MCPLSPPPQRQALSFETSATSGQIQHFIYQVKSCTLPQTLCISTSAGTEGSGTSTILLHRPVEGRQLAGDPHRGCGTHFCRGSPAPQHTGGGGLTGEPERDIASSSLFHSHLDLHDTPLQTDSQSLRLCTAPRVWLFPSRGLIFDACSLGRRKVRVPYTGEHRSLQVISTT